MTLRTLQLSDGYGQLGYRQAGQGDPVVLIHGVGMQSAAWEPQIDALADTHHVVALDMPGHGASSPIPDDAELPDFVQWLHVALRGLALDRVSLVGHSMGALIVAGFAICHPEMVARVALLNGVFCRDPDARTAVERRAVAIRKGSFDLVTPLTRWFGTRPVEAAASARVAEWLRNVDRAGYATAYAAFSRGDATYADRFGTISCPLLALTGAEDPNSTPEMSHAMAMAAPSGRAVIIAGHRHMVNLTAPDRVNRELREWLGNPHEPKGNSMNDVDPRELRRAFGSFMTGVTVVTTRDKDGTPLGFTANSFTSVSLDPPLVLVCLANTSRSYDAFAGAAGFAVNILSENQKTVSNTFAAPVEDRFTAVEWRDGPNGAPVFRGVSAWFDCSMFKTVDAGDHVILIGKVEAFHTDPVPGLGYARGAYVTPNIEANALDARVNLVVSGLVRQGDKVLLLDTGDGHLTLPEARVGKMGVSATLANLLTETGLKAEPGFVYAVYEDVRRECQHITFLCDAGDGTPDVGAFTELVPSTLMDIADSAMRAMLERFSEETRIGNFGIYYGNQISGQVRPISAGS